MRTLADRITFLRNRSGSRVLSTAMLFLLLSSLATAQEPSLLQTPQEDAGSAGSQPGLGLEDFSTEDLQQQFNSVHRFSASPLQLKTPQLHLPEESSSSQSPSEELGSSASLTVKNVGNQQGQENQGDPESRPPKPVPKSTLLPAPEQAGPKPSRVAVFLPKANPSPSANAPTAPETTSKETTAQANPESSPEVVQKSEINPNTLQDAEKNVEKRPAIPKVLNPSTNPSLLNPLSGPMSRGSTISSRISKTIPFGDPFPLSLHGLIWTYIPGMSEYPQEPEFERSLGNLETSFRFHFPVLGRYRLTFSRQYPSTGELEYYNAEIIVEKDSKDNSEYFEDKNLLDTTHSMEAKDLALTNIDKKDIKSNAINYRITSQVISDVRRQLRNGDLESAYQTLDSWPKNEWGDIYDTAAQYFSNAGMNAEAIAMWQRNAAVDGELQDKAIIGIVTALTEEHKPSTDEVSDLLQWLPPFLQLAKQQQDGPFPDSLIQADDFAKIYRVVNKWDKNTNTIPQNIGSVLEFYQTYVSLYPDKNSPEILYQIAHFYELPGEYQNLRQARQLYSNIQVKYPVDLYSGLARQRLNYLNRQFFLVQ